MAPKTKKDAKPAAKAPGKAAAEPKAEKKSAKGAVKASAKDADEDAPLDGVPPQPQVDMEELEEQEELAAAASAQGGSNAAALAAAAGGTEISASFKNFRHHPDMENFYRFIYENDLRHEALAIIDEIMIEKHNRKEAKTGKAHAH